MNAALAAWKSVMKSAIGSGLFVVTVLQVTIGTGFNNVLSITLSFTPVSPPARTDPSASSGKCYDRYKPF
jgi:hypothetical protein